MPDPLLLCVCIKPVWRTDVHLRLDAAGHGLRGEEALSTANPADLAALQLALTLRGALPGARVLALSVAPPAGEPVLREALAAGADEVLRVWGRDWPEEAEQADAPDGSGALAAAQAAAAVQAFQGVGQPALVLAGERSADTAGERFGGFLAAALGAAYAHRAAAVVPDRTAAADEPPGAPSGTSALRWRVTVRLERGYGQELVLAAPAVVTVLAGLPQPPYASLPDWIASRTARIPVATPELPLPRPPPTALRVPVPRVKRYRVPGQGQSAEERIRAMVTLEAQGTGTVLADASPEAQADAVLARLREHGYL